MDDIVIKVEDLGKMYRIGAIEKRYKTLSESLVEGVKTRFSGAAHFLSRSTNSVSKAKDSTIWALKDTTFEVRRGEVVGIIGRNGAGKTTLLKILSRITQPTEGKAAIRGRVGSLLEVGTGFHPELTGRENIYLNGSIMGMRKAEIDARYDEIVDFAEIEKFLDTPVKRYSSGMYMRLAFAVAAHLDTEVLLVDEVLAVGDFKFQEKCLGKMQEVTSLGRTVLFISHNMTAISRVCARVISLDQGKVVSDGEPRAVIREYLGERSTENGEITWPIDRAPGNYSVRLLGIHVRDKDNNLKTDFGHTEPINLFVTFQVFDDKVDLYLRLILENDEGVVVFVKTELENTRFRLGVHEARFTIPPHYLNEGQYSVQQVVFKEGSVTSGMDIGRVEYPVTFTVNYPKDSTGGFMGKFPGVVRPEWDWEFRPQGQEGVLSGKTKIES